VLVVTGDGSPAAHAVSRKSKKPVEELAMSRGKLLKTTGGGVALLAVAATGAGLWRAIDQGGVYNG
jgi:hypothetical protein